MSVKHYQPDKLRSSEGEGWRVDGPNVHGGLMGTVPKFSQTMSRDDADYLAILLERAYEAGRDNAQRSMRNALGMKD